MTALAVVPAAEVREVPWRRLAWVVWRRYRSTLAGVLGVVALLALYLLVRGEQVRHAYSTYLACTPRDSTQCEFAWERFRDDFGQTTLVTLLILFLPGIVGAFVGAPLIARETETGTFRYAWTQGVGRMRWAVACVVAGGLGVAVVGAALGAVVTWYEHPLLESGLSPRLGPMIFPVTGVAAPAWGLVGFSFGVLAGLLWKRVLPALATAFGLWFALAYPVGDKLRQNYLSPLTTTKTDVPDRALGMQIWWMKDGLRASDAEIDTTLRSMGFQSVNGGNKIVVQPGQGPSTNPIDYLLQHGFQQVTSYQPDSRYWTFQWIEAGWLVALSLVVLGVTLWLLRRRAV